MAELFDMLESPVTAFRDGQMIRFEEYLENDRYVLRAELPGIDPGSTCRSLSSARPEIPRQDGSSDRAAGSHHDFPWLSPSFAPQRRQLFLPVVVASMSGSALESPRAGVFIPVLLGAGLAVSIIAGLIERVAASNGVAARPARGTTERFPVPRLGARGAAVVAVIAVATAALYWAAHYRPAPLGDGTTEMSVQVSVKDRLSRPTETVEMMARYCARNAILGVRSNGSSRSRPARPSSSCRRCSTRRHSADSADAWRMPTWIGTAWS